MDHVKTLGIYSVHENEELSCFFEAVSVHNFVLDKAIDLIFFIIFWKSPSTRTPYWKSLDITGNCRKRPEIAEN